MRKKVQLINDLEMKRLHTIKDKSNIDLRIGDNVTVSYKLPNNEVRIFKGRIISKENKQINTSVNVLQTHADESLRMEIKFFIYSPKVEFLVTSRTTVKRAKLFYLRKLYGKNARFKETVINNNK